MSVFLIIYITLFICIWAFHRKIEHESKLNNVPIKYKQGLLQNNLQKYILPPLKKKKNSFRKKITNQESFKSMELFFLKKQLVLFDWINFILSNAAIWGI